MKAHSVEHKFTVTSSKSHEERDHNKENQQMQQGRAREIRGKANGYYKI